MKKLILYLGLALLLLFVPLVSASIGLVTSLLYNVSINSTYSTGAVSIFMPNINVSNGLVIR